DQAHFDILVQQCKRQKERLSNYHQFTEKKCLQSLNWTATVGQLLQHAKIAAPHYLDSYLNTADFDWTEEELASLLTQLEISKALYDPAMSVAHPLKKLHPSVFTTQDKAAAKNYADTVLAQFIREAELLQQAFAQAKSNYRNDLTYYYESVFHEIEDRSHLIQTAIQNGRMRYPDDFDSVNNISIGTRRNKKLLREKEQIFLQVQQLQKVLQQHNVLDFRFDENHRNLNILSAELRQLNEDLANSKTTWEAQRSEEMRRLSSKTALQALQKQRPIAKLEEDLRALFTALNEAKILDQQLSDKNLTLNTQHRQLEHLLEELQSLAFHMKDFELYFDWQRHFLQGEDKVRKLLIALQKARPPQWEAALQSWYLHHYLKRQYDSDLKQITADSIQQYADHRSELRPLLLQHMNIHWRNQQSEQLEAFRKAHKKAFQLIFKKSKRPASLMDMQAAVQQGFDAFTAFVPVIFSTPEAAEALLSKTEAQFDYIIVQEAHLVPKASVEHLLRLGKQQIFIGDQSLTHALSVPSIFEEAVASGLPVQAIRQLYGSAQGLKAAVFQAQSQMVQPDAPDLHIQNVEGRFDEAEQQNTVEAEAVIRLLNQFEPNKIGQYPRIGIATFTTAQRDLILAQLEGLKLARRNLMERFERSGLGVFRLDELYAQEFDILIFSATFGAIDRNGTMSHHINLLDTPRGTALVKSLIASTQQSLYILHSMPEKVLAQFGAQTQKEGRFLLAQFFQYAHAVQSGDESLQTSTLAQLASVEEEAPESALFMDEIAAAIKPYLEKNRVFRNATVDNHNMPLVVQPKHEQGRLMAIYAEGILAEHLPTNYEWEHQMQTALMQQGIDILPVWSMDWWKNRDQASRRLAGQIIARAGEA
ncbi:MAG: hypothetical protein AAGI49_13770, partial [Bacteroidota bacterium]